MDAKSVGRHALVTALLLRPHTGEGGRLTESVLVTTQPYFTLEFEWYGEILLVPLPSVFTGTSCHRLGLPSSSRPLRTHPLSSHRTDRNSVQIDP